jgi:dienelactone hydrolase
MKKIILILVTALSVVNVFGQDISGSWNGIVNVRGRELVIEFSITGTSTNYEAKMVKPSYGTNRQPICSVTYLDSTLVLYVPDTRIEYWGNLSKDNRFVGTFMQSNETFPLVLFKGKSKITNTLKRVKTKMVADPNSYSSGRVEFENKKNASTLAGIFTMPTSTGKHSAVILLNGNDPQSIKNEVCNQVLAEYLALNGVAVLRFDNRELAASTVDFNDLATFDYASNVQAAVDYLKSRKEVDVHKIGLIGHGEGGLIASVAASNSNDINFVVLMSGVGSTSDQLSLLQHELMTTASVTDKLDSNNSGCLDQKVFEMIQKSTNDYTLKNNLTTYLNHYQEDSANLYDVESEVNILTSPRIKSLIKYNPTSVLGSVKCPVLILNGAEDMRISAKVNSEMIKKSIEEGGNKNVKSLILPGLNHYFQKYKTKFENGYAANLDKEISQDVLYKIGKWIVSNVN